MQTAQQRTSAFVTSCLKLSEQFLLHIFFHSYKEGNQLPF
jgi:hypothetical protein